jgi:hypothetical protein
MQGTVPQCCGKPMKTKVSRPTPDGTGRYRWHKCEVCNASSSSLEPTGSVALTSKPAAPKTSTLPMAAPVAQVLDLELAMEDLLPEALKVIRGALTASAEPNRTKVALAQWVIEDRRKWRVGMAEQAASSGQAATDPAIAQLAALLATMPEDGAEA